MKKINVVNTTTSTTATISSFLTGFRVANYSHYAMGLLYFTVANNCIKYEQEAQLMLTNPRDAFTGQSRSPNIVPFHMLGIVHY